MVSLDELNASVYKVHILTTTLSLWGQWSILILNTMLVYGIRTIEIKTKLFSYITNICAGMFLVKWR